MRRLIADDRIERRERRRPQVVGISTNNGVPSLLFSGRSLKGQLRDTHLDADIALDTPRFLKPAGPATEVEDARSQPLRYADQATLRRTAKRGVERIAISE